MIENKLLDSNILVYAFDTSEKEKYQAAKNLLQKCLDRKEIFFVSLQNISEFYSVVTTKIEKPISHKEARDICKQIFLFSGFRKIISTHQTMLDAMYINEQFSVPYFDALIAATMLENQVPIIYTENIRHFSKIPGIRTINPFG